MANTTTNRRMAKGASLHHSKRRIRSDLAAVIAACATAVGSFGVVISGIWMIHLAVS